MSKNETKPLNRADGIRYAVYPGWVVSINDGDRHFIGFRRLCDLYGVSPRNCYNMDRPEMELTGVADGLVALRPRADGQYKIPAGRAG